MGTFGTLLEIVVILLILSSFFLCYMSWKTWRVYQVVLVEFVFLAAVTFSYLSVRTLATHKAWRESAQAWQTKVREVESQNDRLLAGKEEQNRLVEAGIEQLQAELHLLTNDRGSVWFDVTPDKVDGKTGVAQVTIETPEPHEIAAKTVLFVFEQEKTEEGGRFLGEFKVTKAQAKNKSIELTPNLPLTETQLAELRNSKGLWALYATMPTDNAELFAGEDDADLKSLWPKKSKQGLREMANKERALRDYEFLFHQNALECELLADSMVKINDDLERTLADEQKAEEEIKYRTGEKAELKSDLEKFRYEQKAVAKYAQSLQTKLAAVQQEFKRLFASTSQTAALLKKLQFKAADEINRRTSEQASNERPPAPAAP